MGWCPDTILILSLMGEMYRSFNIWDSTHMMTSHFNLPAITRKYPSAGVCMHG